MKCRKPIVDIETRGLANFWDKSGGNLNRCPGGVRHKDGMSLNQALTRNMGTSRSDIDVKQARKHVCSWPMREKLQVAKSTRARVPMQSTGTERLVVAMKSVNADGAKESCYPLYKSCQLKRG
ncbi:MAG: hypothetical protein Q8T09_22645 [Candidatus Melainabacteria bacterium]|nr:hypothetical protein [Candidatus Melainabacteria bacterium]